MTEAAKLDEREQFETWWQSRGKRKPARSSELGHTDEYDTANVEMAWKGWQARAGLRSSSDPDAVRALELIASFPIDEQNQLKRDSDLIYGFNDWKLTVGDVRRARAAQRQLPAGKADELSLAAVELSKIPDDIYWIFGRGRTRPDEPLWGLLIKDMATGDELACEEGDHPANVVRAAVAALTKKRERGNV
jgi:hypothetical protein